MIQNAIIDKFLKFIKSSFFVQFVVFISGMFVLLGDQSFLEKLGLDKSSISGWPKSMIGLFTIIAGACILTHILYKVGRYIVLNIQIILLKKKTVNKIKNLSEPEKLLLFQSVLLNMPVVVAPMDNPIAMNLVNRGILSVSMATAINNTFGIPDLLWGIIRQEQKNIFTEYLGLSQEEVMKRIKQSIKPE